MVERVNVSGGIGISLARCEHCRGYWVSMVCTDGVLSRTHHDTLADAKARMKTIIGWLAEIPAAMLPKEQVN